MDLNECWVWTRHVNDAGYGQLAIDKRLLYAHRVSYALFKGGLDDRKQIHHTCGNKSCFNPEHLIQLSMAEHKGLHLRADTDPCPKGHVGDFWHSPTSGKRACRTCRRQR